MSQRVTVLLEDPDVLSLRLASTTMSLVSRGQKSWPYARGSTNDSVGKLRGTLYPRPIGGDILCWEVKGEVRRLFDCDVKKDIQEYLTEKSDKLQESGSHLSIPVFMVGKRPNKTKPTVLFVSDDKVARKEAFDLIKNSGLMSKYPGFELGHSDFEKLMSLAGDAISVFSAPPNGLGDSRRLFVYPPAGSGRPARMATAGGAVTYGGKYWFLTVDHFLDDDEEPTEAEYMVRQQQEEQINDCEITGLSDFDDDDDDSEADFIEATTQGSVTSNSENDDSDQTESTPSSPGDVDIIWCPSEEELKSPLQPHHTFPIPSQDECVANGTVLRFKELDYALVEVNSNTADIYDIQWNALELCDYAQIEFSPRDSDVKTTLPSGETIRGNLSDTMCTVRLPHSKSFIEVYAVRFSRPLSPGDCGSWVTDAGSGRLFGHVVAGNPVTGLAMIMPASYVFQHAQPWLDQLDMKVVNEDEQSTPPSPRQSASSELGDWLNWREKRTTSVGSTYSEYGGSAFTVPDSNSSEVGDGQLAYKGGTHGFMPSYSESLLEPSTIPVEEASADDAMEEALEENKYQRLRDQRSRYQRPKHPKVYCTQCSSHPEGFRGEYELQRHINAKHSGFVKKYVCRDPASEGIQSNLKPVVLLHECKACLSGKQYGAFYNAAAHLRRTHFRPRTGRGKRALSSSGEIRGGKGGGDWPSMNELKDWFTEIHVPIKDRLTANDHDPDDNGLNADEVGGDTAEIAPIPDLRRPIVSEASAPNPRTKDVWKSKIEPGGPGLLSNKADEIWFANDAEQPHARSPAPIPMDDSTSKKPSGHDIGAQSSSNRPATTKAESKPVQHERENTHTSSSKHLFKRIFERATSYDRSQLGENPSASHPSSVYSRPSSFGIEAFLNNSDPWGSGIVTSGTPTKDPDSSTNEVA